MTVTVSLNRRPDSLHNVAQNLGLSTECCWARGKQVGHVNLFAFNHLCTVGIKYCQADTECFCG